jgi:hypothetical protein
VEQRRGVHRLIALQRLGQVREPDQQEQDERDGREERVEGERARQEREVVFVGGLEGAADEAGG